MLSYENKLVLGVQWVDGNCFLLKVFIRALLKVNGLTCLDVALL